MWDLIVSVPDHFLSFYFDQLKDIQLCRRQCTNIFLAQLTSGEAIYGDK